jgi:hypothetical protein
MMRRGQHVSTASSMIFCPGPHSERM